MTIGGQSENKEAPKYRHLTLWLTDTAESTEAMELVTKSTDLLDDNNIIVYPQSIGGTGRPVLNVTDGFPPRRGLDEIKRWLTGLKK